MLYTVHTVFRKDGNLRGGSLAGYREKSRASNTQKEAQERGVPFSPPLSVSPLARDLSHHLLRSPLKMESFDRLPIPKLYC